MATLDTVWQYWTQLRSALNNIEPSDDAENVAKAHKQVSEAAYGRHGLRRRHAGRRRRCGGRRTRLPGRHRRGVRRAVAAREPSRGEAGQPEAPFDRLGLVLASLTLGPGPVGITTDAYGDVTRTLLRPVSPSPTFYRLVYEQRGTGRGYVPPVEIPA